MEKVKHFIKRIELYIKNDVHNPLSTMSNLTYVLMGYLSLTTNFILGLLQIILGIASGGFHWTRTDCWHKADIIAIFYVFGAIAGYLFAGTLGLLLGLSIAGLGQYLYMKNRVTSKVAIGILGGLTLIPFWILNGWEDSLFVLMLFAIAAAISTLGSYFNPEEDGQWYDVFHAIWHIFSGLGIYYLVLGTSEVIFKLF